VAIRVLVLTGIAVLATAVAAAASKPPAGARFSGRTSQGFPIKLRVTSDAGAVTLGLDTRERCSDGHTYRSHTTFQKQRPALKADGSFDFVERDANVPPVGAMKAPFDQTQHVRGRFSGRRVSGSYFSQIRGHDGLRCTLRVTFRGRRR